MYRHTGSMFSRLKHLKLLWREGIQNHMGPYCYSVCYFGVLPQTTPPTMHLINTLTGPDLYTGLQRQIPFDGSDLRGIELKHIT